MIFRIKSWKLTICSPKTVLLKTENEGSQMSLHVLIPTEAIVIKKTQYLANHFKKVTVSMANLMCQLTCHCCGNKKKE